MQSQITHFNSLIFFSNDTNIYIHKADDSLLLPYNSLSYTAERKLKKFDLT